MSAKVVLDPVTRIEGHLAVKLETSGHKVVKAYCSGEMFRGFENILAGRSPLDAQQITQRICGVCPISHGLASCLAQDEAYGIQPPDNGRIARNLILGANYIQSHILHFYQLSALDFVDITAVLGYSGSDPALTSLKAWVQSQLKSSSIIPAAPFLPRYEGRYLENEEVNLSAINHYLMALDMRSLAHEALALFGAKAPHSTALVPGGITQIITANNIAAYAEIMGRLRTFIDKVYLADVVAVAQAFPEYLSLGVGCGDFLSYGVFAESDGSKFLPAGRVQNGRPAEFDPAKIYEDTKFSLFSSPSGLHPTQGRTQPQPEKEGAYSWLKAPRYQGRPQEVGPLARLIVAYHAGHAQTKGLIDGLLTKLGLQLNDLNSTLGRHAARALECKMVADQCALWVEQLKPGQPVCQSFSPPASATGAGLTEAPRGALGHWLKIENGKIANYQCVVPTTWNCSPRDAQGKPGPVEQALAGATLADPAQPLEAARVVRSFDPCLACAVH